MAIVHATTQSFEQEVLHADKPVLVDFWDGIDKSRAKRGVWRVPERTLFLLPLLGGSIGALLGMRIFRHKTKHWYFVWGIPTILLAQIALAVWIYTK